jgi:hypothetical protein
MELKKLKELNKQQEIVDSKLSIYLKELGLED